MRLLSMTFPVNNRAEASNEDEQATKVVEEYGEWCRAYYDSDGDPIEEALDSMVAIDNWLDKQPREDVLASIEKVRAKGVRRGDWVSVEQGGDNGLVRVIAAPSRPLDIISYAAGTCYGKEDHPHKRVRACIANGHHSVLEHANVTMRVEGISRACLAQLTRHRHASFCVESQRYCKVDTESSWYVAPDEIKPRLGGVRFEMKCEARDAFGDAMEASAICYNALLRDGVKPEDARAVLPNAAKTNLVMTCNVRELNHFLKLRLDQTAQWEIRRLAEEIERQCSSISPQWETLMGWLREERQR